MSKDKKEPVELNEEDLKTVDAGLSFNDAKFLSIGANKTLSTAATKISSKNHLLFDEADALFGKRTEVKDSNDRFSN